jgi:hypothetical protein
MRKLLLPAALFASILLAAHPSVADTDGDGIEPPSDCNDNNSQVYPGAFEIVGNEVDEDCDGHETCYRDTDNDDYRSNAPISSTDLDCADAQEARASDPLDCNDANAAINPGATEVVDNNTDDDCDGFELCYADSDNDGARGSTTVVSPDFVCGNGGGEGSIADPEDCDDEDDTRHPGAVEGPGDEVDQDCDGDEICFVDNDNDGARTTATAPSDDEDCDDAAEAVVGEPIDCDDGDAVVHPGGTEVCDAANEDEDCDGVADDDDTAVGGATPWYTDADGDGYGAEGSPPQSFCDAPPSHAGNDGDCDDTNDGVNPGATESCEAGDPEDYNCDGSAGCADSTCSSAPACTGEVFDHMECFKVKTTEKLKATLDLNPGTNPPFQLAEGCTIGKAAKICVPIMRPAYTVDPSSTLTENPLYEGASMEQESICYKVKCPKDSPPFPSQPSVELLDHFGARAFEKVKVSEICAPAEIVP